MASQDLADLQAVHLRQHEIEDDERWRVLTRFLERLGAVFGTDDLKASAAQVELDQLDDVRLVLDHQDFGFHKCASSFGWRMSRASRR